jgi:hypothetical protein
MFETYQISSFRLQRKGDQANLSAIVQRIRRDYDFIDIAKDSEQESGRDDTMNVHSEVQNQNETNDEIEKDVKVNPEYASQNYAEENTPKLVQSKIRTYFSSINYVPKDILDQENKDKLLKAILVLWVDFKNKRKFKRMMSVKSWVKLIDTNANN